ncbi:MAG: hypothetical protein ACXU87_26380, partial [Xanthobacteraceae bacterium]
SYLSSTTGMLIASSSLQAARRGMTVPAAGRAQGETMKIYMLMVLIGTIAAMSHVNVDRKSPGRGA